MDWPELQRATRIHHTANAHRPALSLPIPGTPLPRAVISDATARKDTVYTRQPLRSGSATSARLYFRLEGGRKQPIAERSGPASPASGLRRASSGRGNLLVPQGAEAGLVTQSLKPRTEGSTSSGLPRARPSSLWPSLGSLPNTTTSPFPSRIASSILNAHCLSQVQLACPQSHRSRLPPRPKLPSTGVGREVSLRGRRSQPYRASPFSIA